MKPLKIRILTLLALAFFTFSTVGCGYILYPERRNAGARSGQIDVVVVVMDILWLIPGILPGVFALVWDGIHGSWYATGSAPLMMQKSQPRPLHMVAARPVTLRGVDARSNVSVKLEDAAGRTHLLKTAPDARGHLSLRLPSTVSTGKASLHIATDGRNWKTLPVVVD
jgi:hypothetical protein